MRKPSRTFGIAAGGALVLGAFLTWFFGNFLYGVLWAKLAEYHVREADMIAYTVGHLTPFVMSFVVVWIIYAALRREFERQAQHLARAPEISGHSRELETAKPPCESPTIAAFRAHMEKETRQYMGLEIRADALRLSFEPTEGFQRTQAHADHVIRTWCLRIENVDASHLITNCRLRGDFNGGVGHLLNEAGTLQAGERRLIDVAMHHEMGADPFIHMYAPRIGGFFAEAWDYLKLPREDALVTFRTTSDETKPAELICRLFVDETGKFQMERA